MTNTAQDHRRCVPFPSMQRLKFVFVFFVATSIGSIQFGSSLAQSDEKAKSDQTEVNVKDESQSNVVLPDPRQLVSDLSSEQFSTRQQAITTLRECPPGQLEQFGRLIESEGSVEAQRRWIDVLEGHYGALELHSDALSYVSECLERDAKSETWFIAEAATKVLDKHWKQRVKLTVVELSRLNFPMDPKDPDKLFEPDEDGFDGPASANHLKLIIDHSYEDKPEVTELLRRLAPLRSAMFLRSPQLVSVFIVDGHPISEERIAEFSGIFGDIAIQRRGPVCLGISPNSQFGETGGVLVGSVAKGKSAHLAGIKQGDRILDLDGVPVDDFDDMVKRLRSYKIGDKVTMKVYSRTFREVDVTLTGWYEGATNAPGE